jgi:hypothetical protein
MVDGVWLMVVGGCEFEDVRVGGVKVAFWWFVRRCGYSGGRNRVC